MTPDVLQNLDRIGTVGLAFIVLCLMRGWLVTKREITQQRADYDLRIKELVELYKERLQTANTAASEWRQIASKAMGVVESAKQG